MTEIDESELADVVEGIDTYREMIEGELFYDENWIPAMHRNGDRVELDIEALEEDLTERELVMWRLGRVEARGKVVEKISDELLDD